MKFRRKKREQLSCQASTEGQQFLQQFFPSTLFAVQRSSPTTEGTQFLEQFLLLCLQTMNVYIGAIKYPWQKQYMYGSFKPCLQTMRVQERTSLVKLVTSRKLWISVTIGVYSIGLYISQVFIFQKMIGLYLSRCLRKYSN